MQTSETPYAADWLAISLRWIVILGAAIVLSANTVLSPGSAWPLAAIFVWNVAMSVLAGENARLPAHRLLNVVVDALLCGVLFVMHNGLLGPALIISLLPILTAAVYFEFLGALLAAVAFVALGMILNWEFISSRWTLALGWAMGAVGLGGFCGLLGQRVIAHLRSRRESWQRVDDARRRAEQDRLRTIYELGSTLTATLSYRRVLDSALDMSYSALEPEGGGAEASSLVSAVLLFRSGQLRIGSARRLTSADQRLTLDGEDGILKRVFDRGEAVLSQTVSEDPELGRMIAMRSCRTAYCLPLQTGFNVYGAMLFAHPEADYFTPLRMNMLDILAGQASIAVHNARLYQDLVEEKERMVEVNEEARHKLARDLHDGPTQSVAAMAMRISIVRRMLQEDPAGAEDQLIRVQELAERAGKEIRHTLFTLRPLVLETQGLVAALKSLAEKMHETFEQRVDVEADESVAGQIETGKQGILFYIVEEALNNARKHANASTIWIRLRSRAPDMALVEVEDDGSGFDLSTVERAYDRRSSLGLINIRERTELINGVLEIQSEAGKGTKVSILVPLTREAAERLQQQVKTP